MAKNPETLLEYPEIVAIDLETTGLTRDHNTLEIGAIHVASGREWLAKVIPSDGEVTVNIDGLGVTGTNLLEHSDEAIGYNHVGDVWEEWITDSLVVANANVDSHRGSLIPMGKNVGGFDVDKFLKIDLPEVASWFHDYREIELNSVMFSRDIERGQRLWATQSYYNKALKKYDIEYDHGALNDTRWSLACWLEMMGYDYGEYRQWADQRLESLKERGDS